MCLQVIDFIKLLMGLISIVILIEVFHVVALPMTSGHLYYEVFHISLNIAGDKDHSRMWNARISEE